MMDNKKFQILSNVITLLSHKHSQSQTQLTLLHGAIKQWADQFYQQLLEKNKIILQKQIYQDTLKNLIKSLQEIQYFLNGMNQFYQDANMQFYYKQYLSIIAPVIYQINQIDHQKSLKISNLQQNYLNSYGRPNFQAKRANPQTDFKYNSHKRSSSSPQKQLQIYDKNYQNGKFSKSIKGLKCQQEQRYNIFNNRDIPVNLSNLKKSISKNKSITSNASQFKSPQKKKQNRSSQQNRKQQTKQDRINENQTIEYLQCLKRLRRQLLNVQKQFSKVQVKNKIIEGEMKKLQGRYNEKQKQVLELQEKLYLNLKKSNKMQDQLYLLKQKMQDLQSISLNYKRNNIKNCVKSNNLSFNLKQEETCDPWKQSSTILSLNHNNDIKFHKKIYVPEMGQQMRMLYIQASCIESLLSK